MGARKWVIGGFLAAAVIIVGLGVFAFRVKDARERATVESDLSAALARAESLGVPVYADQLRGDPIPEEENAWIEILQIDEKIRGSDLESNFNARATLKLVDSSEFRLEAGRILPYWDEVFDLAEIVANKSGYVSDRKWEMGLLILFFDYLSNKSVVRALLVKSRYQLLEGDTAASLKTHETVRRYARHLLNETSEIGLLVHTSIELLQASEIVLQAAISESVDHLVALTELLGHLFQERSPRSAFAAEIVMFVELIRSVNEQNEFGNELRDGINEENVSPIATLGGFSLPDHQARGFEARAIEAACDYFEALSADLGNFKQDNADFADLMNLPYSWALDGYPFGHLEIYSQLVERNAEMPGLLSHLLTRRLTGEISGEALAIVLGESVRDDGETWTSSLYSQALLEYTESDSGFSITTSAPDLNPITLKFDRP